MARCSGCGGDRCSCVIRGGANVTVTGAGTLTNPYVVEASGGGGGASAPVGSIMLYGGAVAPPGWLLANGAQVSRTTYADLFAVLGTGFGIGDGSTTFNLPNLAGRFPLGVSGTYPRGSVGGSPTRTLSVTNLPSHVHGMSHTHTTPAHSHTIDHTHPSATTGNESNGHTHTGTAAAAGVHAHTAPSFTSVQTNAGLGNGLNLRRDPDTAPTSSTGSHTHTVTVGDRSATHTHTVTVPGFSGSSGTTPAGVTGDSSAATTAAIGGGAAFDTMPPFLALNFIVKT